MKDTVPGDEAIFVQFDDAGPGNAPGQHHAHSGWPIDAAPSICVNGAWLPGYFLSPVVNEIRACPGRQIPHGLHHAGHRCVRFKQMGHARFEGLR